MHTSGTRESNAVSSASDADGFPSPSPQIGPGRRESGRGKRCPLWSSQDSGASAYGGRRARAAGVEPATYGFGIRRSQPVELRPYDKKKAAQSRIGVSGYCLRKGRLAAPAPIVAFNGDRASTERWHGRHAEPRLRLVGGGPKHRYHSCVVGAYGSKVRGPRNPGNQIFG